jgi:MFS family permease
MLGHGALGWYPTHLMRTQGVSASDAGYIFSTALVGGVALLLIVPTFAERVARTGRKDLLLFLPLLQIPVGLFLFIAALSQSSLMAASVFMALGYGLLFAVPGFVFVSISVIAPPTLRGRLTALVGFANNIIGVGLGTFLVGFLSDTVFSGAESLGMSLLAIACVAGPTAWLFFYLAWKPYRAAMLRGSDAHWVRDKAPRRSQGYSL